MHAPAISLRFDPALLAQVDAFAAQERKRRSAWIREAVVAFILNREQEAFRRESLQARGESVETLRAFDETTGDGLEAR